MGGVSLSATQKKRAAVAVSGGDPKNLGEEQSGCCTACNLIGCSRIAQGGCCARCRPGILLIGLEFATPPVSCRGMTSLRSAENSIRYHLWMLHTLISPHRTSSTLHHRHLTNRCRVFTNTPLQSLCQDHGCVVRIMLLVLLWVDISCCFSWM